MGFICPFNLILIKLHYKGGGGSAEGSPYSDCKVQCLEIEKGCKCIQPPCVNTGRLFSYAVEWDFFLIHPAKECAHLKHICYCQCLV